MHRSLWSLLLTAVLAPAAVVNAEPVSPQAAPASAPQGVAQEPPASAPATQAAHAAVKAPAKIGQLQVVVQPGPAGVAPGQPQDFMEQQRQAIRNSQHVYADRPAFNDTKYTLHDLVHITFHDGKLQARLLAGLPPQQVRLAVAGTNDIFLGNGQFPNADSGFGTILRMSFDRLGEGQFYQTQINCQQDTIWFNCAGMGRNANLSINPSLVTLNIMEMNPQNRGWRSNAISSPNLMQFMSEHPKEAREFVLPMFERLCGENPLLPGETDMYSVMTDLKPDPEAQAAVEKLLPALDADAISDRDAASAALEKLGAPAVLAVLRLDQSCLSAEQCTRLNTFLADHRRRLPQELPKLADNTDFLIDCLGASDPAIHAAARERLEKRVGHKIDFEEHLTGDARAEALDKLHEELQKAAGTK